MIGILLLLTAAAAFIDAVRRPASHWVEADRNKAFWLTMIIMLNVLGVLAYMVAVWPLFPRGAGSTDAQLMKATAWHRPLRRARAGSRGPGLLVGDRSVARRDGLSRESRGTGHQVHQIQITTRPPRKR